MFGFSISWKLVLFCVTLLALIGSLAYIAYVLEDRAQLQIRVKTAETVNAENMKELNKLRELREATEKILADREKRILSQQKETQKLIEEILRNDPSKECPVGLSIDDALDGLSDPASQDQN